MRKTETRDFIECDMCGEEILEFGYSVVTLKGHDWDLCQYCGPKLESSLKFLCITVGLTIDYSFRIVNYD